MPGDIRACSVYCRRHVVDLIQNSDCTEIEKLLLESRKELYNFWNIEAIQLLLHSSPAPCRGSTDLLHANTRDA